jgi:hypothetical protein
MKDGVEILTPGAWTDQEIERFGKRAARLQQEGLDEMEAEQLAQRMLYRDRPESGDDRRLCLECKGLTGRVCKFAERMGLKAGFEPLRLTLQRCDAFVLRGA